MSHTEYTPTPESADNETWQFGYKKFGSVVVRFVSSEATDPLVLIEKYADQNPWFLRLITGVDSSQRHFGFDYLEDKSYEPAPHLQSFIGHQATANALKAHEGIAMIEGRDSSNSTATSMPTESTPQSNTVKGQLGLFGAS